MTESTFMIYFSRYMTTSGKMRAQHISPDALLASSNTSKHIKSTFSSLRAALDYAWDPYDFYDVYDHFDVIFANGKWRMVDEEGDFMHNDSGSE